MTAFLDRRLDIKYQCSTLVELLRFRALQQPHQIAFTFLQNGEIESDRLTYQMLDSQARAIATQLLEVVKPGDRALMLYPSGLQFISAFFGCLYAGVIAVPAYPPRANHNLHRLQAIVTDAQAEIALTTSALLPKLKQQWDEDPSADSLQWLATDTVEENLATHWHSPTITSNSLAFLQYTSGSTGKPKGVMVTHGNLLSNERAIERAFGHGENTILVAWLPLFHDMGLVGNVLQPLYLGTPCNLMSPVDFLQKPFRWLDAISRYRATSSGGPNFAYDLCLRKVTPEQIATLDLSCWEVAFSGAEPIRAETLEKFATMFAPCGFRPEAFYPCYGMAEATLFVTGGLKTNPPIVCEVQADALAQNEIVKVSDHGENVRSIVGCGQPWLEHKVLVIDPETLTQNPSGKVGEIWVSGPSVAQGYWNRPQQTTETFQACLADTGEGPFLRTGDLGFLLDNELFVTGRMKDTILIRGRNHYPQDIELTVENSHSLIRRPSCCAAFGVEVEGEERVVVVAEVDRRYRDRHQTEVIGNIRQAIAEEHELPLHALLLLKIGSIPRTSSGKIQRHACKNGFLDGSLDVVAAWQVNDATDLQGRAFQSNCTTSDVPTVEIGKLTADPAQRQATIQAWLIAQVSQHLKVRSQEIDIQVPLTRYGLDSVQAVSIVAALEDWLNIRLTPDLLDTYPSIAELSQYLSDSNDASNGTAIPAPNYAYPPAANLIWHSSRILYNHWLQMQVQGVENIPNNQPYLLAANHTSHLDAGAVIVALHEKVDSVAVLSAQDYFFNTPWKGWFFKTFFNLIPFDRQGNFLAALRESQCRLSPQNPLLIFPEGTRSTNGELQPFQAGLGLLALKLNIPIVPVYIQGTFQVLPKGKLLPQRHPISVTFGTPLALSPYHAKLGTLTEREICEQIGQDVQRAVAHLRLQLAIGIGE